MTPIHLLHIAPSLGIGGREARMATLIDRLGDEFRHTLVALDGNLEMMSLVKHPERVTVRPFIARRYLPFTPVTRLLREVRPDVLATYNWGTVEVAGSAAVSSRTAIIHTEDGFDRDEADGLKRRRVLFRRLVLRHVARTVVISRTLLDIARVRFGVPADRLTYIPNAVDVDRFAPGRSDAMKASLDIPAGRFVIGTVARLRPEKNLRLLLEAMRLLRAGDAHLVIVGDGGERAALEALTVEYGLKGRVTFAGPTDDTAPWYRLFDLYALTSTTEQAPLSILEAMASGLPVVSTRVGDVPVMLPAVSQSGLVPAAAPPPGSPVRGVDPREVADTIEKFAASKILRQSAGAANRSHVVERFSLDAMVQAYAALYRSVAGGRP
jgi:glycosyltransferase involved in cell wall biosynthesis